MNCGFANAIIEQHVELQMLSTTNPYKVTSKRLTKTSIGFGAFFQISN